MAETKQAAVFNALNLIDDNKDQFREDFKQWFLDNYHIWQEFEKRSLQVAMKRSHYSARTIAEIIRHDSAIGELEGEYKLNGNYVPCLARLFALTHPRYQTLFEFRDQRASA
jgi:hypothetical protein